MLSKPRIGIIGSGIAGLACANALRRAGYDPLVLDKGRGVGGRTATRRTDLGFQFDHGAQYVTARSEAFREVLHAAEAASTAAIWQDGSSKKRFVGMPGMSGLAKFLANDLRVAQRTEITKISRVSSRWKLDYVDGSDVFDHVVVTAPSAQTADLVREHLPDLAEECDRARMAPCLTLMVALSARPSVQFESHRYPTGAFSWIARNAGKPGRPVSECWVAQANPQWSAENIDQSKDQIASALLPHFLEAVGARFSDVTYLAGHRWRHARVEEPVGHAFLTDQSRTLFAGGDWCLGPRVEAAWLSGTAIASEIANHH